jgi:hypothetical protein
MTNSTLGNTRIEIGIIVSVNTEDCVCTVRTETSEVFHDNIPFATVGLHQESGTGFSYFPQTGETVLVLTTGDGKRFILAFIPTMDDGGSYDAGRENNNPGDYKLTGADGNFIEILRGGITRIGASNICQSMYIPARSLVHHLSENLIIDTFAGSLEFNVARAEDSSDGRQKCSFSLNVQEFSDDKKPTTSIEASSGLTITIRNDGSTTATVSIAKTGEMTITTKTAYNLKSDTDISLKAKNALSLECAQLTTKSSGKTTMTSGSLEIKTGKASVTADVEVTGTVRVGKMPVLTMSPDMGAWMAKVGAFCAAPPPIATSPSKVLFG